MKIFISYSTPDIFIVRQLATQLRLFGEVFYWDESKLPGQDAWQSIFNWIDTSDLVVVLITGNTISRAMPVGQEIGRAKSMGKTIIPLVSNTVSSTELGFLNGVTYQPIDVSNPYQSIEAVANIVNTYSINIKEKQKNLIALAALVFLLWLGTKS